MPSSYTCLHYHLIFSTKSRLPQITAGLRERLHPYIGGIIREGRGELIDAGGAPDHVHLVARLHPQTAVSDLIRVVKTNSSKWAHETFPDLRAFAWQDGYAAFAVSLSNLPAVRKYVMEQDEHHKRVSFQEELIEFLKRHEIPYDERFIWK